MAKPDLTTNIETAAELVQFLLALLKNVQSGAMSADEAVETGEKKWNEMFIETDDLQRLGDSE